MDRLVHIAASGANQALRAMVDVTHNLANAGTPGFREDLSLFSEAAVTGLGQDSRAYTVFERGAVNTRAGSVQYTGRELDVVVQGGGWIAVLGADGEEGYTRRGDLRIDELGRLTNGAGERLLGDGGALALPPHDKLEIAADGTVSILPIGQSPDAMVVVDRIKLVSLDEGQLSKGDDGLLRLPEAEEAKPDASVRLIAGSLESSNVNSVGAMVRMIELSRAYEAQVKLMRVAADNDRASAKLLELS